MRVLQTSAVETPLGRVSFGERGEGHVWVLLHSLLTDRNAFDRIVPGLDGRVVSLDLPGFGQTANAPARIEDHADLMAAAVENFGPNVTVLGNGLGSFVALALAARHPELVERLILVGCGARFPDDAKPAFDGMINAVTAGGMEAVTPTALLRIFTEDYIEANPGDAAERAEVLAGTDPEAFISACTALKGLDLSVAASGVGCPALLVVGTDDKATPPAMAHELADLMPDATVVEMAGVAHAPQLQAPDDLLGLIEDFSKGA